MRIKPLGVAAAAVLLLVVDVGGAAAGARVEQRDYVPSTVLAVRNCGSPLPVPNQAGACFRVEDDDTSVSFTVADDHSERVNAIATFYVPHDEPIADGGPTPVEPVASHAFCSDSGALAVPDGAVTVQVRLSELADEVGHDTWYALLTAAGIPSDDERPCDSVGGAAGATTGTITATFS